MTPSSPSPSSGRRGAYTDLLRVGQIIAYPTESFYALGVLATDAKAIQRLFRVKRRELNKPIALIAADLKQVRKFFYLSKNETALAKKYWPGAVTILLRPKRALSRTPLVSPLKRGGKITRERPLRIGVRVPAHAGARRLAARAAAPITATSANIAGRPPTKTVRQLRHDFPDILVAPGKCGRADKPSTVVELIGKKIKILRPGAVNIQ